MQTSKDFQDHIEIESRLYFHCRKCKGVSLCEGHRRNSATSPVGCPHCGYFDCSFIFNEAIGSKESIKKNEFGSVTIISTLAAVLAKEEQMQSVLRIVEKHRNGINKKELLPIIKARRYRQTLIDQVIYFGFISQTIDVLEHRLSYHLTEKGSKVLDACKKL